LTVDISAQDILATVRAEQDRKAALERRVTDNATRVSSARETAAAQRTADTQKVQRTQDQQRVTNQANQRRIDAEQALRDRQINSDLRAAQDQRAQDIRARADRVDANNTEPLPRGSLVDLTA
jgi:hypothetical protein